MACAVPDSSMSEIVESRFTHSELNSCANVDWITIYQDHNDKKGTLRKVNAGMMLNLEDLSMISDDFVEDYSVNFDPHWHDGTAYKELWRSYKKYLVEGSHSTRLMLFCDGTRVFLSGNVGRFGRTDNLFNLSIQDTIKKANEILAKFGLPPFTNGKSSKFRSNFDGKTVHVREYGAIVTRIDINVNFATGSASNAQYLVDYLQARSMSYVSKSVSGRSSVQWGKKGGRLYTKAYIKHEEMFSHSKVKDRQALQESFAYNYAKEKGIVRIETEIDRKTLYETGLRDLENLDMNILTSIAKSKIDHLFNDIPVGLEHFEPQQVFYKKEHKKYVRTLAMWKTGMDLTNFNDPMNPISKATFYRHQEAILEISGIDISQRYIEGITVEAVALVSKIELQPLECPPDYQLDVKISSMPELNIIDLTKHLPTRKDLNEVRFSVVPTAEFLKVDLSQPAFSMKEHKEKLKQTYLMKKLYEIHKDNNSHRMRGFA